jgi:transforming growth factor-beta-induced protein
VLISTFFIFLTDSIILPEICDILDFREKGQLPVMSRFNSIFHRDLDSTGVESTGNRRLQYQGERCDPNVLDTARENPDLSTFVALIDAADLNDLFLCAGPFTVLAPTNEAFDALDPALLDEFLRPENKELLQEVLLYHILPGFQPTNDLVAGPAETLLYDFNVDIGVDPVTFNGANVVMPDIMACNGIIHTIDDILTPEDEDFCDAFTFDNRRKLQDGGANCAGNVLDTAREDPNLTTVVSLIDAADLADVFSCPGPFTALLPNNAAFDALDPEFVMFLLDPANQSELQDFLLYHILPGSTLTRDFSAGPIETLLSGSTIDVTTSPLMFNDAGVVTPDVEACNGYIDVIDTVLNPFPSDPTTAPTRAPTPLDICVDFTFPTVRMRKLQNGGQDCNGNVFEVAMRNNDLSIVTSLIELANLTAIFSCAGPFTALLPTNTAFDDVDQDLLDSLVLPQNIDDLQRFLLYHILPGATLTNEFTAGPADTLASGEQVDVTLNPLQFDGRNVIDPDIEACNGYIDILDGVLNIFASRTSCDCNFVIAFIDDQQ